MTWRAERRRRAATAAVAVVMLGATVLCHADGPWSGSVAATTDYVFRGVSQTYGGAALQGGLNYESSAGWFAGTWTSNVDPYPFGANLAEINVYAGYGWALSSDFTARTSYTRYLYAWDQRRKPYDYGEFAVTLGFQDRLAATVSYQPDSTRFSTLGYVRNRPSSAYELTGRWPLTHGIALVGGGGYYDLTHLYRVGYWSANAGVNYVRGRYSLDVTRFFSDATVRRLVADASADGRWVATVVCRF